MYDCHFQRRPNSRDFDIHGGESCSKSLTDFSRWSLTNDFSLSGLKRKDIECYLYQHKVSPYRDGSPEVLFSFGIGNKFLNSPVAAPRIPPLDEPDSSVGNDIDEMVNQARQQQAAAHISSRPDLFSALERETNVAQHQYAAELQQAKDTQRRSASKTRKRKRKWMYRGKKQEGFPNADECEGETYETWI